MIFFPSDHLIEKVHEFNKSVNLNKKYLKNDNIFIFGIKPTSPSSQYGYLVTKKISKNVNKVIKFVEKPNQNKAKEILKQKGYWNSGIIFATKESVINNFRKHNTKTLNLCTDAIDQSITKKNVCYINRNIFKQVKEESFDYAILEKSKNINAIKLNITWTDLGSWKEISKVFKKIK